MLLICDIASISLRDYNIWIVEAVVFHLKNSLKWKGLMGSLQVELGRGFL